MLGSAGGTVCYNDQSSLGRAVYYTNGTYRTMLSAVIFGAMEGSQRNALLGGIVEYLVAGTAVAEPPVPRAVERVTVAPNPAPRNGRVRLTLPRGYSGPIQVFDAAGRCVPVSFDIRHSTLVISAAGSYVLRAAGQSVPFTVVR
ncbi:MAG: hypothetical protein R6X13_05410 [bacterium]